VPPGDRPPVNMVFQSYHLMVLIGMGLIHEQLSATLTRETQKHGISYHGLRHRNLGNAHWVEVHLIFSGHTPLSEAHRIATQIEEVIESSLQPQAYVSTHLEAAEDHEKTHAKLPH